MAKSARSKSKKAFRDIKKYAPMTSNGPVPTFGSLCATEVISRFNCRNKVEESALYVENTLRKDAALAQAVASGQAAREQVMT